MVAAAADSIVVVEAEAVDNSLVVAFVLEVDPEVDLEVGLERNNLVVEVVAFLVDYNLDSFFSLLSFDGCLCLEDALMLFVLHLSIRKTKILV